MGAYEELGKIIGKLSRMVWWMKFFKVLYGKVAGKKMGKKIFLILKKHMMWLLSVPGMRVVRQHWHVPDSDWKQ